MSLAVEKKKQTSNRYMLVRITPAKYIGDDLVLDSGTAYKATFNFPAVPRVTRNGVDLTKVVTPSANDEFSYNELTGEFEIWLASAPDESTNVVVCFFDIFYTGEKARRASDGSVERQWLPKILKYPTLTESFTNVISGVLTIKSSAITIANADRHFNQYTGSDYSFKNKQVTVWLGIDKATPERVFDGFLDGFTLATNTLTLKVVDKFDKLKNSATFNDTENEYLFNDDFAISPGIADPNKLELPIPMIVGSGSGMQYTEESNVGLTSLASMDPEVKSANWGTMNEAFNAEYQTENTALNREFVLCRLLPGANLQIQSVSGLVRQIVVNFGSKTVHFYQFDNHNLKVGETFEWDDGSGPYHAIVHHVGPFSSGSLDFNVMVAQNSAVSLTDPIMTNVSQFNANESLVLLKNNGEKPAYFDRNFSGVFLRQGEDYTLSSVTTSGGNKLLKVSMLKNVIVPEEGDTLHYKVALTDVFKHGQCMKSLLEAAGLETNAASFTQADLDYVANARFQVPEFGNADIGNYLQYVEKLAQSSLGFVSSNTSGEAKYEVLATPSGGSPRNSIINLERSVSGRYSYSDTFDQIQISNKHNVFDLTTDSLVEAVGSEKSKHLNEISKVFEFESYLEQTNSARMLDVKNARTAEYSYETATEDIDVELGDDIELTDENTLDAPRQIKITSIQRGVSSTKIKATDLGDL